MRVLQLPSLDSNMAFLYMLSRVWIVPYLFIIMDASSGFYLFMTAQGSINKKQVL